MIRFLCLCTLMLFSPCLMQAEDILLQKQDLVYEGAFRVPGYPAGFVYSGYGLAYNPSNNSLFLSSIYRNTVAEISIPTPVINSSISSLNTASIIQNWADPTEGGLMYIYDDGSASTGDVRIGSMLVNGSKLLGTTYKWTATGGTIIKSHWIRDANLSSSGSFNGTYQLGNDGFHPNYKARYLGIIPPNYRTALGGDILSGGGIGSVASSTSFGPSIYVFNSSSMQDVADGKSSFIPSSNMLVGYPFYPSHRTLGDWTDVRPANPYISSADEVSSIIFPVNSKSILILGKYGSGDWCYKSACTGPLYPVGSGGVDAKPYKYRIWAYNVEDVLASKNNHVVTQLDYDNNRFWDGVEPNNIPLAVGQTVQPWNVVPYGFWDLDLPYTPEESGSERGYINGAAYDAATQKIYLSQFIVDSDNPVIHTYRLNLASNTKIRYRIGSALIIHDDDD